jgi:transcription elongation factor Elf1
LLPCYRCNALPTVYGEYMSTLGVKDYSYRSLCTCTVCGVSFGISSAAFSSEEDAIKDVVRRWNNRMITRLFSDF